MSMTIRKRLIAELEKTSMTVRELSQCIRISEKEVIDHMGHVARSLRPLRQLAIDPPVCHKCGFVFSGRRRFSSPSRCPECRHEGIQPPAFWILSGAVRPLKGQEP